MTEIQVYNKPLTAAEIRANVNLIQEVMTAVMKKDVHYGTIPGTQKPTLYKAGSEKILATFRIAVELDVDDLSSGDCFRYRVKARGIVPSGEVIGCGIGECSTDEEKYRWRGVASEREWDATPEDRKRIKYGKSYETKQIRTNPADLANTVLKMAKKRAQIDLTLTATAASDVFEQDIEDLPEEYREGMRGEQPKSGKPEVKQPQSKKLTESQTEYFPRIKAALDTLHGNDVESKKSTLKKESTIPAKGDYPEKEGIDDYRSLDGKRLEILAHKLEKLAEKAKPQEEKLPVFCNECRTDPCSCEREPGAEG
jgi:hypothetical protein